MKMEKAVGRLEGSISAKIDVMLLSLPLCRGVRVLDPHAVRPWAADEGRRKPSYANPCNWGRGLGGSVFYAVLFVPFIFALLQQTMVDGRAVDPYKLDRSLSRGAWGAGVATLVTAVVYVSVIFNALGESTYAPGSARLAWLLFSVVAIVAVQQALTLRYILLRPELSKLEKPDTVQKHLLCGRAYSSMNPRNWVNYIYLSVVVGEFLQFMAIVFHPAMPWLERGTRPEDEKLTVALQQVVPEFLVGHVSGILVGVLLAFTVIYLLLVGEFVYSDRTPSDAMAVVVCEFFAGTCYPLVVARLFVLAANSSAAAKGGRTCAMLLFFVYSTTASFLVTLRGEQQGKDSDIKFLPLWLVLERILTGILGIAAAIFEFSEDELAAPPPAPPPLVAPSAPPSPLLPSLGLLGATGQPGRSVGGPLVLILLSLAITAIHLFVLCRWRTCSVTFVTRARVALLCVAAWGQFVTLMMLCAPSPAWWLVLIVTLSLALVAAVGWGVHKVVHGETSGLVAERKRRMEATRRELKKGGRTGSLRRTRPAPLERQPLSRTTAMGEFGAHGC